MFNKEKTSAQERNPAASATLISAGTLLRGDVSSQNDLRIDGTIQGNVTSSARIIVGPAGFVEGQVQGLTADINGRVEGNITVKELLQLRGDCQVTGNIQAGSLQVEPTATFNGLCQMGAEASGQVVPMKENDVKLRTN